MQTFLPYCDFVKTAKCLDMKRLGKQRVESFQLLTILLDLPMKNGKSGKDSQWKNHPAARMWRNHEGILVMYYNAMIDEWVSRGYNNTMKRFDITTPTLNFTLPNWLGDDKFHASHRSNLLRKDPIYYGRYGWTESSDLSYIWPV